MPSDFVRAALERHIDLLERFGKASRRGEQHRIRRANPFRIWREAYGFAEVLFPFRPLPIVVEEKKAQRS